MEAISTQRLQLSNPTTSWVCSNKLGPTPTCGSLRSDPRLRVSVSVRLRCQRLANHRSGVVALEVSASYKNDHRVMEAETLGDSFDESLILKNKSQEVVPYLNGRSIYLVGMMGSGKTTVGKILSNAIGYSFCDSDKLVEEDMKGTTVAEIFKRYGENFFRDSETEALKKLSAMHRMVVSTGGGAVIRPVNWKCMQKGVSLWLDVPLEALAQRIAAVGTNSRPLLNRGKGDAYTKAFLRLSSLWKERGEAYSNANARVSVEHIADKLGLEDVCDVTPTMIVIEALEQIENYLEEESDTETNSLFL